jgi:hypothetical protein
MRKRLVLALALVLSAFVAMPAVAQEAEVQAPEAQVVAVAPQAADVAQERAPTIHVTPDEIRQTVRTLEEERAAEQDIFESGTWLTVAVIAAAVAVALILLR